MHRTGAKEWGDRLNTLIDNQPETTKVLGITATPRRDTDGINMANEMAERLGYTNKEAVSGKHIAMNMSLTNAIRMGLVVNPKLVSCAYSLNEDGSLDRLKDKIEQIQDLEKKNEKLAQYETLRRNIENAEGIPEILQANVKKGGKYIVFLPIVDELEDEDGNIIGRKKGKDKIKEYEKQIAEYFKGSDITPNFHSMLGKYGDKENAKRLEEFQNSNTEETEFMLVMNKANEGLHLDKLDGMIWLRPMDENSRILYLQQLGRVIYSEDPDNPTKDEDRPVVIDLVNNTIKVNWEDEITEQDDIQMLNLIIGWTERHNGTLPNINSSDKEETGYAIVLKEIQNKYKGYLENEFDGLNEKQIEEVKEIINLGSQIDLWQIELPKLEIINNISKEKRSFIDKKTGPFEITGLLKDFVDLEKEIDESNSKSSVQKFIDTLKKLKSIGVDVSKIIFNDTIETLAKKSGISRKELEEAGIDTTQKIGNKKNSIVQAYRGKGHNKPPTKEQLEELQKLGINFEVKDSTQEFIDTLKQLKSIGVDISKIVTNDTIETLAKKSGISRKELEEAGIDTTQKIGNKKNSIVQAYRGKGHNKPPTKEQLEELQKLEINLEIKDITQEFIDTLKQLKSIGVDVSKIISNDTIETLAKKSGISRKELEELSIETTQKIGLKKNRIANAYRGTATGCKSPTKEQLVELQKLGINLEVKDTTQEFIETLKKLKSIGVDVSKIVGLDTIETLAKKSGISKKELEEVGINSTQKIGSKKKSIALAYRGKGHNKPPTKEQLEELQKLGINLEVKDTTQEFIETLKKLKSIGVDVSKIVGLDTIETLAKKSGISIKELEEVGIESTQKIGKKKNSIVQAYRGKGTNKPPTKEQVEELKKLGISLESKKRTGKEIAQASISSLKDIETSDREDAVLKELVEKTKEGGIKLDEQS